MQLSLRACLPIKAVLLKGKYMQFTVLSWRLFCGSLERITLSDILVSPEDLQDPCLSMEPVPHSLKFAKRVLDLAAW